MLKEIPKKCKPNAKQTINCEGNLVGAYAFLLPLRGGRERLRRAQLKGIANCRIAA